MRIRLISSMNLLSLVLVGEHSIILGDYNNCVGSKSIMLMPIGGDEN